MDLIREMPRRNGGPRWEAHVFSALHASAHVVRSAEFATVDGALDCEADSETDVASFADRLYALAQRANAGRPCILVPFDVKSSSALDARGQAYSTTPRQRAHAAFYLCLCAADPAFVELVPNPLAGKALRDAAVTVTRSRDALVDSRAYRFLSPCNALYRMPLALLPAALASVRAAVTGGRYTNPWTKAAFAWTPHVLHAPDALLPDEHAAPAHFTAYEAAARIQRAVHNAHAVRGLDVAFDLVLHQPSLADFCLFTSAGPSFVQHKLDAGGSLDDVTIARADAERVRHYFTAFERFDYLLYEFQRPASRPGAWETWFFFLPERVLPDRFYTTLALTDSFADAAFRRYWLRMDPAGEWVSRVCEIIRENPVPRRPDRPLREEAHELEREDCLEEQAKEPGRQGRFFRAVLDVCARRSGLLVVLAKDHPLGDFAYCRYRWTAAERMLYAQTGCPPCALHDLAAETPVVPVSVFARQRMGSTRGPSLTAVEARRLASCGAPRLLCFDVFGSVGDDGCPLLVVPSDDISHTPAHRRRYEEVLATDNADEFTDRVPRLAEQLHSGLAVTDYTLATGGPSIFEPRDAWADVWSLLERFAGTDAFVFPNASPRRPERYQVSLREVHQGLADEYADMDRRHVEHFGV